VQGAGLPVDHGEHQGHTEDLGADRAALRQVRGCAYVGPLADRSEECGRVDPDPEGVRKVSAEPAAAAVDRTSVDLADVQGAGIDLSY